MNHTLSPGSILIIGYGMWYVAYLYRTNQAQCFTLQTTNKILNRQFPD